MAYIAPLSKSYQMKASLKNIILQLDSKERHLSLKDLVMLDIGQLISFKKLELFLLEFANMTDRSTILMVLMLKKSMLI